MSTLAVKVVLDTRRALLKNAGSKDPIYPIKLRVTFARKQRVTSYLWGEVRLRYPAEYGNQILDPSLN